ncbi:MAG: DUF2851 family protein [Prevotellaceae bacterium]|nr:DUF2851 family protein [Prevotellaceae bacterium]
MEKLLHYIWRHRIFPLAPLFTTDGEPLEVVDAGQPNPHAGPDFFNAKVRIGSTMWAGNVELHLRSSDWRGHGHDTDENYNNVILHVAQEVDCPVAGAGGKLIPQLQLPIPASLQANYEELLQTSDYPRCHKIISALEPFLVHSWLDTLLCEREEARARGILRLLDDYSGDWERVLFVTLARSFGFGLNGDAFEQWARLIPFGRIGKHRDDLFQIEALFLGTAGLLEGADSADDYERKLQREYAYQRHLFSLPEPLPRAAWKYLRLRPQNFPHIRMAEMAWMYSNGKVLLSHLLDCAQSQNAVESLCDLLSATTSDYWLTHTLPGKPVAPRKLNLTKSTRCLLIVNAVVPVLYAYAISHGDDNLKEHLFGILRGMPAEDNRILRVWKECGLGVSSVADSQALIELKTNYCDRSDCLRCSFGYEYLKNKS